MKDDDGGLLERLIEAIITLHETHQLRDRRPRGHWESRTLSETTARFCTKWEPRCVVYICTLTDDSEQPLKRYRNSIKELQKAFESSRINCIRTNPGCLICELDLWGYDGKTECYCKRLAGDWSQGFVDRIESFRPEADEEDLYEDLEEDQNEEKDEEKDDCADLTQD